MTEFGFPPTIPTKWMVEYTAPLTAKEILIADVSFGFRSRETERREGRFDAADVSFPVIVGDCSTGVPLNMPHLARQGDHYKYRMFDGAHRINKQKNLGETTIMAYILTKQQLDELILKEAWMKLKEINCPHTYVEMYLAPESL